MSGRRLNGSHFSGRERQEAGCIVSFEGDAGAAYVVHRTGPSARAIKSACDAARARDATLRVVAISSPETIMSDLLGRGLLTRSDDAPSGRRAVPEPQYLTRSGELPMLHPSLVFGASRTNR